MALGQVLLQKASCLVLDEPTNHMDFQTVEALTQALQAFAEVLSWSAMIAASFGVSGPRFSRFIMEERVHIRGPMMSTSGVSKKGRVCHPEK